MKYWKRILAGAALGIGLTGGAVLIWRGVRHDETSRALSAAQGQQLLEAVMRRIEHSWVDSLSLDEIYRRTALGLVDELDDPNSEYLTPARLKRLREFTTGTYSGVGMSLDFRDSWLVVTHVRVGTPAERAGIAIGDRLVEINGQSIRGWTLAEVITAIRGDVGTTLSLGIQHGSTTARIPLQIEREEIHVSAVTRATRIGEDIGYFLVSTFNDSTARDVEHTVDSLVTAGAHGLIIDMRGNPGGLLSQGVEVADLFLDKGVKIASTKGRQATANADFLDKAAQRWPGRPIIVLVNGNTASAAEIFAGALQENDRAVLVGRQTYGKGSAQTVLQLEDGGGLKLTSARWYTPLGRSLERAQVPTGADDDDPADTVRTTFRTGSGRMLTGGGGIRPDIVSGDSLLSPAERAWMKSVGAKVTEFRGALTSAAERVHRDERIRDPLFMVDAPMRDLLFAAMRARGVEVQRPIFDDVRESIDRLLGQEIARIAFGIPGAQLRAVRTDAVIAQATALLQGVESADALVKRVPKPTATASRI